MSPFLFTGWDERRALWTTSDVPLLVSHQPLRRHACWRRHMFSGGCLLRPVEIFPLPWHSCNLPTSCMHRLAATILSLRLFLCGHGAGVLLPLIHCSPCLTMHYRAPRFAGLSACLPGSR